MSDASRPRLARKGILPAGALAAALIALLAVAPFASAATPNPLASGTTTMTLQKSFTNYLKTFGISVSKISPAKLSGGKATFKVTGGSLEVNGKGTVDLGGGLKFKAGKKSATVKGLVLDTKKKALTGKVGGTKVKIASIAGWSSSRKGFGINLKINKVKLTNAGATQLNKKLGFSKGKPKPFLGNKLIAKATSETEPATVNVLPIGNMTFSGSPVLLTKLNNVKVNLQLLGLTQQTGTTFTGPILGGTVSPLGTAGVVQSGIGLNLVQNLPTKSAPISTTITLGGMYVDLAAKTATVEVVAVSNAESGGKKPLNLGALGRSSIADITVTGVNADPTTRTVNISAAAVLQAVSAEVLQGFVSVYKGYSEEVVYQTVKGEAELGGKTPQEADELGKAAAKKQGEDVAKNQISAGEALGTFSFTAQAE
ncbi:MAG TPA: hypothetical protein VMS11_00320 [Solirubrobacterales bacterium]|nr:hypothetical protein [Solirubrobacterales bacterium]